MVDIVNVEFDNTKYGSTKQYSYLSDIPNLQVGDYVVTDSRTGYGCAKVISIRSIRDPAYGENWGNYTAWLVQKVDFKHHKNRGTWREIRRLENQLRTQISGIPEERLWQILSDCIIPIRRDYEDIENLRRKL